VNAGKYSTTFFAVLFASLRAWDEASAEPTGIFVYPWAVSAVSSSLYAYAWDIRMDWGLLDSGAGAENRFLREEIVYSSKSYYYLAIFEDLTLR